MSNRCWRTDIINFPPKTTRGFKADCAVWGEEGRRAKAEQAKWGAQGKLIGLPAIGHFPPPPPPAPVFVHREFGGGGGREGLPGLLPYLPRPS